MARRRRLSVPILALYFFLLPLPGNAREVNAREIVDGTGAKVQLKDRPRRVVTLIPSLGELAADMAGTELEKIVGVSEFTDFPPALKKISKVGPYTKLNLEAIIGLNPDLVLASSDGNSKDQVQRLRELGLPVVVVSTDSFEKVGESMRITGAAMGVPAEGERIASQFHRGLNRIRERAKSRAAQAKKKVLLQIAIDPLIVVGRTSFLNDALKTIGAVNVYEDISAPYPRPAMEDAISRDPDVIVIFGMGASSPASSPTVRKMLTEWNRFPALKAVKNRKIRVIEEESILRPTLRLLEGLDQLEKAVYDPR